jgi:hypothetical protein
MKERRETRDAQMTGYDRLGHQRSIRLYVLSPLISPSDRALASANGFD